MGIAVNYGTSDIDASVARVRELGGEASDTHEIPNVGRDSERSDTEGNAFRLFQGAM